MEDIEVMRDEAPGPVLRLVAVGDVEEGMRRANAAPEGLTPSVGTRFRPTAPPLQRGGDAEAVTVNDHVVSVGEATGSWGGVRESEIGRFLRQFGPLELCQGRYATLDAGRDRAGPWCPPSDEDGGRLTPAGVSALLGRGRAKLAFLVTWVTTERFRTRVRLRSSLSHPHLPCP